MRTIISLFFCSLFLSLVLSPIVRNIALRLDLVDLPSGRKVHLKSICRVGGIAIFLSLFLSLLGATLYDTSILIDLSKDTKFCYLFSGAVLIFLTGLIDDIRGLSAKVKLLFQIIAGSVAYAGGLEISTVSFPVISNFEIGFLSYPATILWFVLLVNAINLIDGLDGLAAGVSLFVCIVLTLFGAMAGNYVVAALFSCLSGAILGFLRYNFNPASIFMGDSGSYFLGYMIAGLSLFGSIKGQTAATLLITMIALGVPLMDTIWATIRRFSLGQGIFKPDKNHFHHRLLKNGVSHKKAVLILYAATVLLCTSSLLLVYINDKNAAVILMLIALGVIMGIRKLGYFDQFDFGKFIRWATDLQDNIGLSRGRRVFLALQLAMHESQDMDELKLRLTETVKMIDISYMELKLGGHGCEFKKFEDYVYTKDSLSVNGPDENKLRLFIKFPLEYDGKYYGQLTASKDHFDSSSVSDITLRRIEILRRTISRTMHDFKDVDKFDLYDRRRKDRRKKSLINLDDVKKYSSENDRRVVDEWKYSGVEKRGLAPDKRIEECEPDKVYLNLDLN